MTSEQLEACLSLSLPIRCFTFSVFSFPLPFISLPSYFGSYSLHPYLDLNLFFHYIWKYKESHISLLLYLFKTSGVRIFFEDEEEIPDFQPSFTFEELLILALDLARIFLSKLAAINKIFVGIRLKEELQPELFITQLNWNIISLLSPEIFTVYLNLKSQFEQARGIFGSKQMFLSGGYQQTSIKTYSVQMGLNFLADILMDIWINVFEYVDAYLKAPWVITLHHD